jgi:dCTP diphosphatase
MRMDARMPREARRPGAAIRQTKCNGTDIMSDDEFQDLEERLRNFAEERDWDQFHSPKNLSMALITEAAELVEHFQWLTEKESTLIQGDKLEAVRMELADIQIYLIRIADKLNVDLLDAVDKKIAINEQKYPVDKVKGQNKKYTEYD